MLCPIDGTDLVMTERSGVEIDYCPKCRGVWLDRGELDKIIERSGDAYTPERAQHREDRENVEDRGYRPERDYRGDERKGRKRKNPVSDLLGDIFDF